MTDFDAGKARGTYELDLGPLRRQVDEAKRALADLDVLRSKVQAPTRVAPVARATTTGADPSIALQRQEAASLRLARAESQLALAQGDASRASTILSTALKGVNTSSIAAIQTQTQLERVNARLGTSASGAAGRLQVLPRTIAGLSNEAAAFARGFLGVAGVTILAQFATDAGKAGVALERTQATLRAVAGSQTAYAQAVSLAKENQQLFGRSLEENLGTLQQFLFISNRTGAELEELTNTARLLATINPGEGIAGAGFALSELASGDITSIVERFNLSRTAINELKAAAGGDTAALLRGVNALLAEQGVTAETLAAGLTENALAYNALGAAAEGLKTELGLLVAGGFQPVAQAAGDSIPILVEYLRALRTGSNVYREQAGAIAGAADEYGAYLARVNANNTAVQQVLRDQAQLILLLDNVVPGAELAVQAFAAQTFQIETLTQAQFAYAKALQANGADWATAESQAREYGNVVDRISRVIQQSGGDLDTYASRIIAVAAENDTGRESMLNLAIAYEQGSIGIDQFALTLQALERTLADNAAGLDDVAEAAEAIAPILDITANAAQGVEGALKDATTAAYEQANAGGDLEAQARAAADALLLAGDAGVQAAARLAGSAAQVDILTAALFNQRREAQLLALQRAGERFGTPEQEAALAAQRQQARSSAFTLSVERAITEATGTTAQRLALVNEELARSAPLSEERRRLLVEQARLQQQLANEQVKLAKSASSAAQKAYNEAQRKAEQAAAEAEREAERRAALIERTNERIEQETDRHYETLTRSEEDYQLGRSRDEEDFQRQRRKLLAEGRIFEARELEEEFRLQQRRDEEDQRREVARQRESYAKSIAELTAEAQDEGISAAALTVARSQIQPLTTPVAALSVAAQQALAPSGAALGTTLRVQFEPISLLLDGKVAAQAVYPEIETRLDAALAAGVITISAVAPPGSSGAVGGPRP